MDTATLNYRFIGHSLSDASFRRLTPTLNLGCGYFAAFVSGTLRLSHPYLTPTLPLLNPHLWELSINTSPLPVQIDRRWAFVGTIVGWLLMNISYPHPHLLPRGQGVGRGMKKTANQPQN